MSQIEGARLFREAWIEGVHQHFPGEPKAGYVTPWDDTPQWEREAAGAVYKQVRQFIEISNGNTARLRNCPTDSGCPSSRPGERRA